MIQTKIELLTIVIWLSAITTAGASVKAAASSDVKWTLGTHNSVIQQAFKLREQGLPKGKAIVQLRNFVHIDTSLESVSESVHKIFYYPEPEAVQEHGSDSVVWNIHNENLEVLEVAVISADGELHTFDPQTAQILDTDSQNVFTTNKELVMQLPGLDAGSISILSYKRTTLDRENYYYNDWAQTLIDSEHREFLITWDDNKPMWYADPDAFACNEESQQVLCVSLIGEPVKTDPNVYYRDVIPRITVATSKTWEDIIAQMRNSIDQAKQNRSALKSVIQEISLEDNALASAVSFVAKQIRYVSFSEAEHAYVPHKISRTLESRYGDCKDKSTLLLALLEELDINAYPVLVATESENPASAVIPTQGFFDHMVVCAEFSEGERCFDPTDIQSSSRTTPQGIQGKVRLNLLPGSKPSRIPSDEFMWNYQIDNEMKFLADGSQEETLTRTYQNAYATWMRSNLNIRSTEDRAKWLEEVHGNVVSGAKSLNINLKWLNDVEMPLQVSSTAIYEGVADPRNDLSYRDASYWLMADLNSEKILNEHYSVETDGVHFTSTYRYDLGDLWSIKDLGPDISFDTEFGQYNRKFSRVDNKLIVNSELRLPSQVIEVENFSAYNRFIDLVSQELQIQFWANQTN